MNTDGTGFHTCKECHKTESLWNHSTTDRKEGEQLEDRRSVGASSCKSGEGTNQRVQSLMFMMMMMMIMMILNKKVCLDSRNFCTAMSFDRQGVSYCFMWFTANQLMIWLLCKQLAGAADDSTHTHTARYATDDNTEVMWLCTDLQLTENVRCTFDWCLN